MTLPKGLLGATPAELLRRYGLSPRKSWGQNFLHDPKVHQAIVQRAVAATKAQDFARVVEIGVGLGTLTAQLLAAGLEVWGIERDRDLCEVLRREFGEVQNFCLHEADAVRFDYRKAQEGDKRPTIVGNLPYQLTGPLLFSLLEVHEQTGPWIVMVQKEVAQRLVASPGNKTYGGLTVAMSRLRRIDWVCEVGPGAFLPPPKVDSAVICLEPREQPVVEVAKPSAFLELVRTAFQQRRKTLLNTLSSLAPKPVVLDWCQRAQVDPKLRPEAITVRDFGHLQRAREEALWSLDGPRGDASTPGPKASAVDGEDELA